MPTGRVKWFNDRKGYGFIEGKEESKDIFVHFSVIQEDGFRSLLPGQEVEYSITDGPKGPLATKVVKLQQIG